MSNYIRSVRSLTAELRPMVKADADAVEPAQRKAAFIAERPHPIAVVGVHGISPIQQYSFQDQLATGLLAYLNARDDARFGLDFERRCAANRRGAAAGPPGAERRSGRDRRSGNDRRIAATPRAAGERRRPKPRWAATPYWPRVSQRIDDPVLKPSALRLHSRCERNHVEPSTQVYDVYEGYWSPLSKGKSKLVSLALWLLRITFLATSSTARIPATWGKLFWDLGYLFAALGLVLAIFGGAALAAAKAWTNYLGLFDLTTAPASFWKFAASPFGSLDGLPRYAWVHLVLIVVLAYFVVQLVQLAWGRYQGLRRNNELLQDSGSKGFFRSETIAAGKFHSVLTIVFIAAFLVLSAVDWIMLANNYQGGDPGGVVWESVWLIVTVGLVQLGRWLADFVVESIMGDVQVYTTHDCNNEFYTIRQQIVAAVTNAVLGAVNAVAVKLDANDEPIVVRDEHGVALPAPPLYGKIHIAGHSLGSTIAMDVLLRVRQLSYEGAVTEDAWGRVRSLTTFGTSLEKTRFLLDVRNPTVSAAQQQWQNDAYGRFFTVERATLDQPDNSNGIYWENLWYFRDVVANKIVSYRSDAQPGSFAWANADREICANSLIPHPRWPGAFVHGDYIGDALFWKAVGPTLTDG